MIPFFYVFTAVASIAAAVNFYFHNYWLVALISVFYVFYVIWGCVNIRSNLFVSAICSFKSDDGLLLTFDDGPTENTHVILDELNKHDVKAIFFCVGKQVQKYPEIVKRIVSEGHMIGVHTYHHSPFFIFKTVRWLKKDCMLCQKLVEDVCGVVTPLFRPAYGYTNPEIAALVKKNNLTVVGWNVRSMDTMSNNSKKIFERLRALIDPGAIVLLHDTNEDFGWLLDNLSDYLVKRNMRFANPSEVVSY